MAQAECDEVDDPITVRAPDGHASTFDSRGDLDHRPANLMEKERRAWLCPCDGKPVTSIGLDRIVKRILRPFEERLEELFSGANDFERD